MTFSGLLHLVAVVAFVIVAVGVWAFDMEVPDAVALTGAGLARGRGGDAVDGPKVLARADGPPEAAAAPSA